MPLSQQEKDLIAAADSTTQAAAQALDSYNKLLNTWNDAIKANAPKEELDQKMAAAKAQFEEAKAATISANDAAYAAYEKLNANPNKNSASDTEIGSALSKASLQATYVTNRLLPGLKESLARGKALRDQTENPQPPPETDANTAPSGSTTGDTTTTNADVANQNAADTPPPSGQAEDDRASPNTATNENDTSGSTDPGDARRSSVGIAAGGVPKSLADVERSTGQGMSVSVRSSNGEISSPVNEDWRVRVSLATNSKIFYKSNNPGIQAPLINTSGVVFPYTPSITVQHTARYGETKLTHSNYSSFFYEGSEVGSITIAGDFTVQNEEEGKYVLATLAFFRSCTKMWFGNQEQPLAGNPPPMVFLNGYGKLYFPNVPCVVMNFTHTMPAEVDYLEVRHSASEINPFGITKTGGALKSQQELLSNAATRVPTNSTMSITVQPVYSRKFVHEGFNLDSFATGELLLTRGGFI